jgi:hypothetical protein
VGRGLPAELGRNSSGGPFLYLFCFLLFFSFLLFSELFFNFCILAPNRFKQIVKISKNQVSRQDSQEQVFKIK